MKCRKHPADPSSALGVCASCLHDRLLAVIAIQTQAQAKKPVQQDCRKSDPFPLSVSPYISRRKSDNAAGANFQVDEHNLRFYSTPQVGSTGPIEIKKNNRKNIGFGGRFSSLFMGFFRSKKSEKLDLNLATKKSEKLEKDLAPGRRKNQFRTFSLDEGIAIEAQRRTSRDRDRGLSPAKQAEDEEAGSSGYLSESSQGWKQTPQRTPIRRAGGQVMAGNNRNLSVFCFSPLVRASPNRHWNQKCVLPETVVTGESRVPAKQHLSTAASFCKNRSRKLADVGRYNNNPNY